jgi:hypothetical protein
VREKEIVFRGGVQRTVWRRTSTNQANDAWDLCCMALILIESMKLRFAEEMKPDYFEPKAAEEGNGNNGQSSVPKWGVIHRAPLPGEATPSGPVVPIGRVPQPQDKPRPRFGIQNVPLHW